MHTTNTRTISLPADSMRMWRFANGYWSFTSSPTMAFVKTFFPTNLTKKPHQSGVGLQLTYVKFGGKLHYICAILNLYARKVITCWVSRKIDRFLSIDAWRYAVKRRRVYNNILYFTNRRGQFASRDFYRVIDELRMVQPIPPRATPYGNAFMETFSST